MKRLKRFISWIFCPHGNWSDGNRVNKRARLGLVEYVCLDCEKTIYRDPWNPPLNKHKSKIK